jgi:anti-sigma factor RsiW
MSEPITATDLEAYIDDQLDLGRRIEVEDYLSQHPDAAARVMADLRARDALRVIFNGAMPRPADVTLEAARRLNRGLARQRIVTGSRRAAAVVMLVGLGWILHGQDGFLGISESDAAPKHPAFVDEARHAHQTALVRARMASMREDARFDPADILQATGIVLPALPKDWRVRDVQVFPAREGQSVELSVDTGDLGSVSLYAARADTFGVLAPALARGPGGRTAYWQTGQLVYALTADAAETPLEKAAGSLSAALR